MENGAAAAADWAHNRWSLACIRTVGVPVGCPETTDHHRLGFHQVACPLEHSTQVDRLGWSAAGCRPDASTMAAANQQIYAALFAAFGPPFIRSVRSYSINHPFFCTPVGQKATGFLRTHRKGLLPVRSCAWA